MSTALIKEKFSRASQNYDKASFIQKQIADEFLARMRLQDCGNILDIGIGTGYLAQKIKIACPGLSICGLDLAYGMLYQARKNIPVIKLIQADAKHLPFSEGIFDTIISNLTYQWISDLDRAFSEVRRALKDKGRFYFTAFSHDTLKELRESILKVCNKNLDSVSKLPRKREIRDLLTSAGFKDIKIDLKTSIHSYPDLAKLLSWLKLIGANKYWLGSFYKGLSARRFLESINKYYDANFRDNGKIFATFETLFIEAEK